MMGLWRLHMMDSPREVEPVTRRDMASKRKEVEVYSCIVRSSVVREGEARPRR